MLKVKLNKRYKTTRGYTAFVVEELPRGEFPFKALMYNKTLKFDWYAYFNHKGQVQGMQSFYGNIITEINK